MTYIRPSKKKRSDIVEVNIKSPFYFYFKDAFYYFSSERTMLRVMNEYENNCIKENEAYYNRYGWNAVSENMNMLKAYYKYEGRGFCILTKDNEVITCPEQVKLIGESLTKCDCLEQSNVLTRKLPVLVRETQQLQNINHLD